MKTLSDKRRNIRQTIRRVTGVLSLLLFPATFYYFSPYLSVQGAAAGKITGSVLLFGLLFLFSLVAGRLFCSWVCPAGILMELADVKRKRPVPRVKIQWIKYLIWTPWVILLVVLLIQDQGQVSLDPGYATQNGFSVSSVPSLIMYLMIVFIFFILSTTIGKRAGCHVLCWMAPFMILGRTLSTALRLPALRLKADSGTCSGCKACERNCPMGLEVCSLVKREKPDHYDCILCGECVDNCPSGSITYRWQKPQTREVKND